MTKTALVAIALFFSHSAYAGNCDCPYDTDRAGQLCGDRSAWSRAGGVSPVCYASNVAETPHQASTKRIIMLWKEYKAIQLDSKTAGGRSPSTDAKIEAFKQLKAAVINHAKFEVVESLGFLVSAFIDLYISLNEAPCLDFVKEAEAMSIEGVSCAFLQQETRKSTYVYLQDAFTFTKIGLKFAHQANDRAAIAKFEKLSAIFIAQGVRPSRDVD